VGITAGFLDPINAHADKWGGETTYPDPEPFTVQSNFILFSFGSWESLLDGKGPLALSYSEKWFATWGGAYIEPGSISLTNATLVLEGTVIPEPATLLLTAIGVIFLRRRPKNLISYR